MRFRGYALSLFLTVAFASPVLAGPLEEAQALAAEGDKLLERSKRGRKAKRKSALLRGVSKYARAYMVLTAGTPTPETDALLAKVKSKVSNLAEAPVVVEERQAVKGRAIEAAAKGRFTDAYDLFARLRDLDPRDRTVDYVLGVIGQRMDASTKKN